MTRVDVLDHGGGSAGCGRLRRRFYVWQRCEGLCICQRPLLRIVGFTDARQQLTMLEEPVDLREAFDLARRDSFEDVHGPKLVRVSQARRAHQLAQRSEGVAVKLAHAHVLVVDDERALAPKILCRHAGWAAVGMASLRLDAT